MSEAHHTPGPWLMHHQPGEFRTGEGLDFSIMQSDPLRCLSLMAAPGDVTKEFVANVRLMAAAPELLKVLQSYVDWEVEYMTINNLGDPEKQHNVKWARAVIAKATGA